MKKAGKKKTNQSNKAKIRPLNDRILVAEHTDDREKKTSSGIILPAGVNEDKTSKYGKVVAVGPGRTESGKIVPTTVKVGDEVVFQWGDKLTMDGKEYYVVRESEILAVIK